MIYSYIMSLLHMLLRLCYLDPMSTTAIRILLTPALMWECFASVARYESEKHFDGPYHITIIR
jgi:hypothetical protein